jgi:methionine sulfoxide reductase heme-binding subunit
MAGTARATMKTGGSRVSRVVRDWKFRHIGALAIAAALVGLFGWLRPEWSPMHRWNRAFGDASLVLVAIVMAIGPVSRLWRRVVVATPWRRELGVWAFVAGLVHAGFILFGWVDLEWERIFGLAFNPNTAQYVMFDKGFGLSNVIGILALVYGLVLALTSNDLSQRWLGMSVWKFMQQGAYILWILILAHTAYFLYMHFLDFHKQTPEPNLIQWPFAILVLAVFALQQIASWRTWRLAGARVGKNRQGA